MITKKIRNWLLCAFSFASILVSALDTQQSEIMPILKVSSWNYEQVRIYTQELASTMRKRTYTRYALAAALAVGTLYKITGPHDIWQAKDQVDVPVSTESIGVEARIAALEAAQKLSQEQNWFIWTSLGNVISVPIMVTYEKVAMLLNYVATSGAIGALGYGLKSTIDFLSMRDNSAWFCEHELHLSSIYASVCSCALEVEKHPHSELKKRMLFDVAHQYKDCLMKLVVFLRYKADLLVPSRSLDQELCERKATITDVIISNLELYACEFVQEINTLLAPGYTGHIFGQSPDEMTLVKSMLRRMQSNLAACLQAYKEFEKVVGKKSSFILLR